MQTQSLPQQQQQQDSLDGSLGINTHIGGVHNTSTLLTPSSSSSHFPSSSNNKNNSKTMLLPPHSHHGQRPSLAGFDPFLSSSGRNNNANTSPAAAAAEPTLADLHATNIINHSMMMNNNNNNHSNHKSPIKMSSSSSAHTSATTETIPVPSSSLMPPPLSPHMNVVAGGVASGKGGGTNPGMPKSSSMSNLVIDSTSWSYLQQQQHQQQNRHQQHHRVPSLPLYHMTASNNGSESGLHPLGPDATMNTERTVERRQPPMTPPPLPTSPAVHNNNMQSSTSGLPTDVAVANSTTTPSIPRASATGVTTPRDPVDESTPELPTSTPAATPSSAAPVHPRNGFPPASPSGNSNHKQRIINLPSPGAAARKLSNLAKKKVRAHQHRRTRSMEDGSSTAAVAASATTPTATTEPGHHNKPPHPRHGRSHSQAPPTTTSTTTVEAVTAAPSTSSATIGGTGAPNGTTMVGSSARRLSATLVGGINSVRPRLNSGGGSKSKLSNSNSNGNANDGSGSNDSNGGIVQELMDLKDKFMTLQMPSLAKPSPTSFLTGNSNEAVRTSEYEPSPFQMEIPTLQESVEIARLNDFVENYRRVDQNYDLEQLVGKSRLELQNLRSAHTQHVSIVQSLLECGDGLTIQGFQKVGTNPDDRLEAVVFEGQRHFTVIFRGRTEQQSKLLGNSKSKKYAVPLDTNHQTSSNVEVYSGFKEEYMKLERDCFELVDKLSEQNPFCDFVFTGYSFGAALATLAALRYATVRPMMRIGCVLLASPKVGFNMFRHMVNSLPNLKVSRIELGQDAKCQCPSVGGWHVGHTIVLHSSIGQQTFSKGQDDLVLAYRFDVPKHKKFKTTHPDLRNYVVALEECQASGIPWAVDFVNTTGKGVVVNNEARLVV